MTGKREGQGSKPKGGADRLAEAAFTDPGLPVRRGLPSPALRVGRRGVLKLLGSSLALALGGQACVRKPPRRVISREHEPEFREPGIPLHYASTWTEGRFPYGIVVRTLEGRPVKIEGNPDHPVNRGASSAAMQASLYSLYDPSRLRAPRGAASWEEADRRVVRALEGARRAALLTRATLGPSERALVEEFVGRFPAVRHFVYEPLGDRQRRLAWREIYGRDGEWLPRYERAAVILSLGADFLGSEGPELEAARALAEARLPDDGDPAKTRMARLYVVEGDVSLTGMNADQRLRLRPSAVPELLAGLRQALPGGELAAFASRHGLDPRVLGALLADLRTQLGEALVVAGEAHSPAVHAAVALLNEELGAAGRTLEWNRRPATLLPDDPREIAAWLTAGVDLLLCLGVDPVHSWPGGGFEPLLRRAALSVAHALQADATATLCDLALPSHHNLESWNDAEPRPGLASLCQPAIRPLFDTRQEAVSLMTWMGLPATEEEGGQRRPSFRDRLRRRFQEEVLPDAPSRTLAWQEALRRGVVVEEVAPVEPPLLDRPRAEALAASAPWPGGGLELVLGPHHGAADGRFATNAWLLELPDPVTRLMWDNALRLSPRTAASLGLKSGDLVEVRAGESRALLPALQLPGMAEGVLGADLGLGRRLEGPFAGPVGFPAWPLAAGGRLQSGVSLSATGRRHELVLSQLTFSLHGRPIVLRGTAEDFRRDPRSIQRLRHRPAAPSIYPPYDYSRGPKWAMAIDLQRCTGCQACVVACQAENNIPPVGKSECANGREMHWLRVDLYREGGVPEDPRALFQPMLCQQCDNAPCENVCPVNAATHSHDGLNEQIYNRCVGTRYCANNCPYKVRRFNFFRYQRQFVDDPLRRLMANPSVTVRDVGVMEKCTFCIQRINAAKFAAANAGRPLRDGEIRPACQEACPAGAIVFGDVNLHQDGRPSEVARWMESPRAYLVLEEHRFDPNVTYLARLANPAVEEPPPEGGGGHG